MYGKIGLIFMTPRTPALDASNRLKLGTAFLYSAVICMHYRQLGCAKRVVNYRMSKLLKPAFAAQIHSAQRWVPLQPRAQGIPNNGISGSHNRTGSAPRGRPSFGISGNVIVKTEWHDNSLESSQGTLSFMIVKTYWYDHSLESCQGALVWKCCRPLLSLPSMILHDKPSSVLHGKILYGIVITFLITQISFMWGNSHSIRSMVFWGNVKVQYFPLLSL
jgi:hypothetical protein